MRIPACLLASALATFAVAQSPLVTSATANNSGNSGGGVYFDLQIFQTVTITEIRCVTGSPTTAIPNSNTPTPGLSDLEVWLGPTTYNGNVASPQLWTLVATGTGNVAMSTLCPFTLATPLTLGPGNYGVALKSRATASGGLVIWGHGYTNGVTCTSTTVPGACANGTFTRAEMQLRGGAAQNAFLSGGVFSPRIFSGEIHYTLGGTPIAVAAWEPYGRGCYANYRSFYELFPNPGSIDVANTSFRLSLGPSSNYLVARSQVPYTAPSANATTLTFANGNDNVQLSTVLGPNLPVPLIFPQNGTIGTSQDLQVNADGYISPIGNAWAAPTVASFQSGGLRWVPHWKNLDVVAGGSITVEVESGTGAMVVSWNGVFDNGGTAASSFQVAFYPNADVEYRYGAISIGGGGSLPVIIGWAGGAGSLDNPIDVSAATLAGFATSALDNNPLTLAMNARPRLGTTPNFVTTSVPAGTSIGVSMLSFVQFPMGTPLQAFGAPGCFQYMGAEVSQLALGITGTQFSFAFPIPNSAAFNGLLIYSQSATLSPGWNPLGIVFSNGVRMFMGSL